MISFAATPQCHAPNIFGIIIIDFGAIDTCVVVCNCEKRNNIRAAQFSSRMNENVADATDSSKCGMVSDAEGGLTLANGDIRKGLSCNECQFAFFMQAGGILRHRACMYTKPTDRSIDPTTERVFLGVWQKKLAGAHAK